MSALDKAPTLLHGTEWTLQIESPAELEALGRVLSVLGIGASLVSREMTVCWLNEEMVRQSGPLMGEPHCFSHYWGREQRCSDCLPALVFRTAARREGFRERVHRGSAPDSYRVQAIPVADCNGEVRWVLESFVKLSALSHHVSALDVQRVISNLSPTTGAAFVVVDAAHRIVSWSPSASVIFGYPLEGVLGKRVDLLFPAERLGEREQLLAECRATGGVARHESVRVAADGRLVPVAVSATALLDENGEFLGRSTLIEDLSALHQLRARLEAQRELLANITQAAADAIVGLESDGSITSWNHGAEEALGVDALDALGRPLAETVGCPKVHGFLAEVLEKGTVREEAMSWTSRSGKTVAMEVTGTLFADSQGVRRHIVAIARDVSTKLRLERQLMRSEKMAVVGSLAAGLAHEIGTPLNVISATAEFLMMDAPENSREELQTIVAETERISGLVKELLSFARGSKKELTEVDIVSVVHKVGRLVRIPMERKGVRFEVELEDGLPLVCSEPDGLHQALLNVLLNAINAVQDGGRIRLRGHRLADSNAVGLDIEDDGEGVDDAIKERVFDPFFTTNPEGTGLGLSVCARFVQEYGGDISVDDSEWGGARFSLTLPMASAGTRGGSLRATSVSGGERNPTARPHEGGHRP